ncbi:hypothetical protein Tco_1503631 [Tanacetum coccineum]
MGLPRLTASSSEAESGQVIQALIDKKKLIITETSIRSDLTYWNMQEWKYLIHTITQCLSAKSTAWNEFSSTMASLIICLATNQRFNLSKYIFDAMVKHLDGGTYRNEGVVSGIPTDSLQTPIATQPSSSRSQKKQSRRKQRKDTAVTQEETQQDDSVPTPSNDPPLSGEDSMQLSELMILCTNLQKQTLERRKEVKNYRCIQTREDNEEMFDTNDLHGDEVNVDMPVGEKQEQSAKEREVDTSVEDSAAPTTIEEITLAQTLIQIKAAKPKVVTTAATTTTTTRPKARGVVVQEPSEFRTPQESQPSMIKDKGKAIMIEPEVPLKRKDQVALDEDLARNLQAQLEAELIEEERLARKKEEEANIALIESWDNTQAMMEADFELAQRLQTEEQGEITIEERSRLFVELMNKRKKHFAMLRAEEKRRKPPTKAQKRNLMSTYLKNMGGYKHNQLKSKSYKEIQKLFDNEMRRVNTFIPIDSEEVKKQKGNRRKF